MVAGILVLVALIRHVRIEDRLNALFDQRLDMAVYELGRIADTLRRNGIHTLFEKLMVRSRRDHDRETELGKDSEPERIVLIHIQRSRDTDLASWRLILGQRFIAESSCVFICDQVRERILCLLFSFTSFTAVTGDKALAVAESGDRQFTVVSTERTCRHLGRHLEAVKFFKA